MNKFNHEQFESTPVIGILRNYTEAEIDLVCQAFLETGLSTLEITVNSKNALQYMSHFSSKYPDLNIGAGTVCTQGELTGAVNAGASFIVCPICDINLIHQAKALELPIFPGALTPTEIYQAWQAGATAVKVFPASTFGPSYIKEVLAPLSEIKLLPTGGVNIQNMAAYFKAGAAGVGMGSALVGKRPLATVDYPNLIKSMLLIKEALIRK
jgi:2-dehydro-3-deoxyphosphogluconate aldolase/(4S)-4-hydroxy-2-oxoglutarate aldolase